MATLRLHASAEAVLEVWRGALADGQAVELGAGHATLAQLVEAAADAAPPAGTRLGALGELLVVDAVADEVSGELRAIARTGGLRRSLRRNFAALRRAGVSARVLGQAAASGAAREVARGLAAYERRLGTRLIDDAARWRRGCERLATGAPLRLLDGVDQLETIGIVDWDAAALAALDALLARGLALRVVLPSDERNTAALAPALAALESRHAQVALEVARVALDPAPRPAFVAASSPFVEAREVARRVRDLVDAGTAPEAMVVCATSATRRAALAAALRRYGVPVAERRPDGATAAPPARLVLDLYALVEERIGRERLIALVSSRYVAAGDGPGGRVPAQRLARALREAGVGDAEAPGYDARLDAWARGQPEARRPEAERAVARIRAVVETLRALPGDATVAEHAAALARVLDRLQLPARTRGLGGGAGDDETRVVARDQKALRALLQILDDLPPAAARVGLAARRLGRARFAHLLGEALAEQRLGVGGVRGAAVELTDLGAVAGRRIDHLFVCGLVDGETPARAVEDALLSDDERVQLNRALGQPALPLAAHSDGLGGLAFARALAGAAAVTLSWTRADEDGAPQLRSPLVDLLQPSDGDVAQVARDPLPRVADARSLDELTARVALECRGDRGSRLTLPDREGSTELYRLLTARAPARLARLEHLVAVERQRERFFAGATPPHAHVGALADPPLLAALAARLPGRAEAPLSASAVETFTACGFQFLLKYVLGAAAVEEADDDLDPMARGQLHHRVLERWFVRLRDQQLLPLDGSAAEESALDAAAEEVLAEWRATNPIGHPELFAVFARRLRRQLRQLLDCERRAPPAPGCVPARFEARFGPLPIAPPAGDEPPLFVQGKIDRVDIGVDRAVVLDYKSGSRQRYAAEVKPEALCVTSWQLPLYAAVIRAELGAQSVEARFYSLRDARVTNAVDDAELIALDDLGRRRARAAGKPNLADALWERYRALRGGEFTVRPVEGACERCRMESACRVARAGEDEETGQ